MTLQGIYTAKGALLREKVGAGLTQLTVTRAAAGSGQTAAAAGALAEEKQALTLGAVKLRDGRAYLPTTLAEAQAAQSYTLTELGVYARDPQEGEILYQVFRLSESRVITAGGGSAYRFYLCAIGSTGEVVVECSSGGLLIEEDLDGLWAVVNRKPDTVQYDTTLHVAKTGSDTTGDGSEVKPYFTIQKALDSLPKLLLRQVSILIHAGSYEEDVVIYAFTGCGKLTLCAMDNETVSIKSIYVSSFTAATLELVGFSLTGDTGVEEWGCALYTTECSIVDIRDVTCTQVRSQQTRAAFTITLTTLARLNNVTISNQKAALECTESVMYLMGSVSGVNNTVSIRSGSAWHGHGGFVQKGGAAVAGEEQKLYGGQIW